MSQLGEAITDDPHRKRSRQYYYQVRKALAGFCTYGGCKENRVTGQYCRYHADIDLVRRKAKRVLTGKSEKELGAKKSIRETT